jgi:hypothetical protein
VSLRARSLAGVPISACGGDVRIIASIEDPAVINQILAHLERICRHFLCL